jgi:hypothetical protein
MKIKRITISSEDSVLYHVTDTKNAKKILKTGLIPNKSSLGFTKNQFGGRLSKKGYVYAFEDLVDAVAWVMKACWAINQEKDYTVLSIIKFKDDKSQYVQDKHHESSNGLGRWLMKEGTVSPDQIVGILPPVKQSLGKFLIGLKRKHLTEEDLKNAKDISPLHLD